MNEKEQIIKPVTLVREEFMEKLAELTNNSSLPFFVIEDILKNFLQEIHIASQHQLETDKQRYLQEVLKMQSQVDEESLSEE